MKNKTCLGSYVIKLVFACKFLKKKKHEQKVVWVSLSGTFVFVLVKKETRMTYLVYKYTDITRLNGHP